MKIQIFELLGFELTSTRELPIILEIGLLTPKNIRRSIPEKLANFSGNGYIEQIKSEFKEPIDSFHHFTKVCARSLSE